MQFLHSTSPLAAQIVIGSFGSSTGYDSAAFSLSVELDPNVPIPVPEKPLRYGKLPEIHHIFRGDAQSPNIVISLVFAGAVVATLPALLGAVRPSPPSVSDFVRISLSSVSYYCSSHVD